MYYKLKSGDAHKCNIVVCYHALLLRARGCHSTWSVSTSVFSSVRHIYVRFSRILEYLD